LQTSFQPGGGEVAQDLRDPPGASLPRVRMELALASRMTPLSPPTWNRAALFSALDARNRRARRSWQLVLLVLAASAMVGSASILAYLAVHEVTTALAHATVKVGSWTRVLPPARECVEDQDCALRPSVVTCCGTCPAARPFEAAPVGILEMALREADVACGPTARFCEPPACPIEETGSDVRAACVANRCAVVER
jgi:hypothetical protein